MREDDITGISQEFDLVLSRVMPPRGKGAQERDMEMANHHKMRPEAEVEERLEEMHKLHGCLRLKGLKLS